LCQLNPSHHIPLISIFRKGQQYQERSTEPMFSVLAFQYIAQCPVMEGYHIQLVAGRMGVQSQEKLIFLFIFFFHLLLASFILLFQHEFLIFFLHYFCDGTVAV
jgi:hypothetical protein